MKRLYLIICVFGLMLIVFHTAKANTWQVVYETDFSADPGWTTDNPQNFYWESASGTYFIHQTNYPESYEPDRYTFVRVPYLGGPFRLEWDLEMLRCDWSAGLNLGMYDSNLSYKPGPIAGSAALNVEYVNAGEGRGFKIKGHQDTTLASISNLISFDLNVWYHNVFEYEPENAKAKWSIYRLGESIPFMEETLTDVPVITNDIGYLGASRYPVLHPWVGGVDPYAAAEARIDNVVLYTAPEPEPLTGRIVFVSDRDGNEEIYIMNVDGSNQIRLTNDPGVDASPVFSPDGETIAFISNRSGSFRIYTMLWNGTELYEVPNSECNQGYTDQFRSLAWSPDGQKLLFRATMYSLATINLDGSGKTILLTGVGEHDVIWTPEWGPTMDDVYFNAQPYSWGYDQHIFHYSIADDRWTQITQDVQPKISQGPQVSPDGSRIVYFRQEQWAAGKNIFTMDLDGGNVLKLTYDGLNISNCMPDWVGETYEIVFSSNKSGRNQIWLMDSAGGNLRMLKGEGNNYAPSWAPIPEPELLTGRIAFVSPHPDEGGRLWVMDASVGLSSKVEVPLPQIFRVVGCPDWSRDDSWIAFHAAKKGENTSGIYVVKPDGSFFCKVNPDGINIGHPSFSPDGSKIVGCTAFYSLYIFTKVGECDWQTEYLTQGVHPHWSPDGQKIAYSNWGLTYDSDIFVYDLKTNSSTKITSHDLGKAFNHVIWSPDGTKLTVVELDRNTNKNNLCVMNADGSDTCNLTADWPASDELWPTWSADGQYIVFSSDKSGNWDLWYTPVDDFAPVNLTNSPEDEVMPAITIPELPEPEWSFVHMTDIHVGASGWDEEQHPWKYQRWDARERFAQALEEVGELNPRPDFILITGDIVEHASDSCRKGLYGDYLHALKAFTRDNPEIEIYPLPGNHDRYGFLWGHAGLCSYTKYVESTRPDNINDLIPPHDYFFENKALTLIGLDSGEDVNTSEFDFRGTGLSDDQMDALETQLNQDVVKIVFMHHPAIDVQRGWQEGSEMVIVDNKDEFIGYCESSNVKLVLAGHTHEGHTFDVNGVKYVQTPSVGKDGEYVHGLETVEFKHGYRIIDVDGGVAIPRPYKPTEKHDKKSSLLYSPANLHVYDSLWRHVGLVDANDVDIRIPHSFYFSHQIDVAMDGNEILPEKIIIFDPCDDYLYQVVGTEAGTYRLEIISTEDGNDTIFEANDIPTLPVSIHKYLIDWDALSQGQNGVTVIVDVDGDGDPEKTIISDNELTSDEFDTPPIAKSGGPYMKQATSWLGAVVNLDGTESSDPDGDDITYDWDLDLSVDSDGDGDPNNDVDAVGPNPEAFFCIGQTKIALVAVDKYGVRSEQDVTTVTVSVIKVGIDIKPGSFPNSINMGSSGVVPVAFLTDPAFDASNIDPATVTLRGEDFTDGLVKLRGKKDAPDPVSNLEDVDGDGDLDLVVHLVTEQLAEYELNAICELGALTYEGYVVSGSDTIRVVPE